MRKFFLLIVLLALCSFSDTSLKKRISDAFFRYEFYTTNKIIDPKLGREYYWFKGGAVHNSEYGVGGELLHEEYLKFYHSNQLAEAGKFKNGLKEGYWKTWHPNGLLQSKVYWDEGQMDGSYLLYNENGQLTEEGSYKNNKRHGRWINYIKKDTVKYREGEPVIKKIKQKKVKDTLSAKSDKPGFFKRIFSKKKKDANGNTITTPKQQNQVKSAQAENDKPGFFKRVFGSKKDKPAKAMPQQNVSTQPKPEKKDGFFKRLFSKKDKPTVNNGQG